MNLWRFVVLFAFFGGWVGAQPPNLLWLHTYGGPADEVARDVAPTHDGGWILVGFTTSAGNKDLYLVRLNAEGDTLWTCTVGGLQEEEGTAVVETPDHGVLAVGYTYSFGAGNDDVYVVKTDSLGQVLWTRTYGGAIADEAYDVLAIGTSGFLVAGRTYSFGAGNFDMYLLRLDAEGDTLWTRTYGGTITDGAQRVIATSDGGFLLVGYTYSFGAGNYDAYAVKVDSAGQMLWQHPFGGPDDDVGTDAVETPDGGFLLVGYSYTYAQGPEDGYLVKVRPDGSQAWFSHFGGPSRDEGWAISPLPGGTYLVAGFTMSYGVGDADAYLVEMDSLGNLLGYETFGSTGSDGFRAMAEASGRLVAAGTWENGNNVQALAAAFEVGEAVAEIQPPETPGISLQWNPHGVGTLILRQALQVRIIVYDGAGRRIAQPLQGILSRGVHRLPWHPVRAGVYFLRVESQAGGQVFKVWAIPQAG